MQLLPMQHQHPMQPPPTQHQHPMQPLPMQHQLSKLMQPVSFTILISKFTFCLFQSADSEKSNVFYTSSAAPAYASYATTAYAAPALKTYAAARKYFDVILVFYLKKLL